MRLALRISAVSASRRPASAAAGTRAGASRTASKMSARTASRCCDDSARAVNSTARLRRKDGLSVWPLFMLLSSAASAPLQSPCWQRKSSTAWAAQPTAGLARTASSAKACAAAMSPRRCASTNNPWRPSSRVSAWSAMVRKVDSAAARLPASCAAMAQEEHEIAGRAQDRAEQRPQQDRGDRDHHHDGDQHRERGLDGLAEPRPYDRDFARTVGEPGGSERDDRDRGQEKDDADHLGDAPCGVRATTSKARAASL